MLAVLLFTSCKDETGVYVNQLYTDGEKDNAIKACLYSAADSAVAHLCTYDGYYEYRDGLYRLTFSDLQTSVFDTLANHNYGYLKDTLIYRANRLAESCAANVSSALETAVSDLDIQNYDELFNGESGAITDYFKFMESENIRTNLQSPVSIRMDLFNVTSVWNEILTLYRNYNSTPVTYDLQNHIVTGMMDGIFEEMTIEEELIRTDSTHRDGADTILVR